MAKEAYRLDLELPDGSAFHMVFKLDEAAKNDTDWQGVLAKRLAYRIEQVLRNETPEDYIARIEKEYQEIIDNDQ